MIFKYLFSKTPKMGVELSAFITFLCFISFTAGQSIGKIIIDGFGDAGSILSNNSDYRLSLNETALRYLHVSIQIQDSNDQDVPLNQQIQVTCEQQTYRAGYSKINYTVINFNVGGPVTGQVQIISVEAGRPVTVRCYGETIPPSSSPECPQSSTSTVQFCKSTSYSNTVSLALQPAPIVSFCQDPIQISNTVAGTFNVRLSEAVVDRPVAVTCSATTFVPGSINLDIASVDAPIGATEVQMSYRVISRGNDISIRCSGASRNGGNQYGTDTSISTTSTARFTEKTGTFEIIPEFTRIYTTSLKVYLKLDRPVDTTGDVSGVCQTVMTETLEEAKVIYSDPVCTVITSTPSSSEPTTTTTQPTTTQPTTTQPTTTEFINSTDSLNSTDLPTTTTELPTTTTAIPIDLTSPWIIDEDAFQFERGEYYKSIVSRRLKPVIGDIVEYVVVKCCTSSPPTISSYTSQTAAVIAEVSLTLDVCSDCIGGITSGVRTEERSISNPAFVEVSPCSCDIIYRSCDVNCCCDTECTEDLKETFSSCISGPPGGLPPPVPDRMCTSQKSLKEDWSPLLCVVFEENSFLGLYHTNQPKITTDNDFKDKVNSKKNLFELGKSERRFTDPNAALKGYVHGADIRTKRADITLSDKGTLALPQTSASGQCVRTAPVQYLKEFQNDCVTTISPEFCTITSILSARVYSEPSSIFRPPCPEGFEICEGYGTDVLSPSYVNYYCASDSYIQNYLKGSTSFENIIQPNQNWTFNSKLGNEDCGNPCENPNCVSYNTEHQVTALPLPPRCAWDNGYTRAQTPQVVGDTCQNSVIDVRYRFTWKGQKIVQLDADIILGTIPVVTSTDLTQSFKVDFTQDASGINNSTDNYNRLEVKYDRSGHPGYEVGKEIFSGCYNSTSDVVDIDVTKQMAVWKPGVDGLCYNAGRQSITFGEDTSSSCTLRLGLTQINNCENLRTLVYNHLNTLMPSNVLGRQGYNDPNNQTFWVQVLRQNITELLNKSSSDINKTNITNSTVYPGESLQGICTDLTTGIHLDILYGETGQGNGYPIQEIVGARISYTIDDWQLSCSGSNSVRCQNNSNFVETFLLTSSIQYIKVPANTPVKQIKFWTVYSDPSCQTDACQRYYENFDRSTCHYDTCWHELFYPLSSSYTADSAMYALGFTLVTVIFVIAYYMIGQEHKIVYGIHKDNSIGNIINTFPTECCT
ncbi:hypothetical protein LOTGIDRAFT_228304 [Lottia gigantea]|uniref:Uncharacterized protein n=1 Tax=Lottia gigantea TaxID=225164 RepID=V4AV54_LOTGI|nr:hypothetical protein LOTGIDRAFT_228304 [Lottia gigantea]ESO97721.1 hypothetical protein LOTGIDRAFT_228304 [Lottia gigantea]